MKLTKEVVDEYTNIKSRINIEAPTEAEEARYTLVRNEIIIPAYKEDPSLTEKVQKIIELKRMINHVLVIHDNLRKQIAQEIEAFGG